MKSKNLKRLLSGVLALGLMSTINMTVSAFPGDMQQQGDLNRDGSVNYIDVLEMKKIILGISQQDNRVQNRADLNRDGAVNSMDLAMLKSILFQGGNINPPQPPDTTTTTTTSTTTVTTTSGTTVTTEAPEVVQDATSFTFSENGVTA